MNTHVKNIVIVGPESTGKSTLCSLLAAHYNTVWCPEYAREYLTIHGTSYTYEDLAIIAKRQTELQKKYNEIALTKWKEAQQQNQLTTLFPLLFVDTDMMVMKVWSEFVFGKTDPFIIESLATQQADLYLLCNIDLPWEADEMREYPGIEKRKELFEIYYNLLINQHVPWKVIVGNNEKRIASAIETVESFLLNGGFQVH